MSAADRISRVTALTAVIGILVAACATSAPSSQEATSSSPALQSPTGQSTPAAGSALERVMQAGVWRMAISGEKPFAYLAEDFSAVTGTEVELVRTILGRIAPDAELETVLTAFEGILPSISAGRVDSSGAGMFIRPTRCEGNSPSDPYLTNQYVLITLKGNPNNIHSLKDIAADPSLKHAVYAGSAEDQLSTIAGVAEDQKFRPANIAPETYFQAILSGRADATTLYPTVARSIPLPEGLEIAEEFEQPLDADGQPAIGFAAVYFNKNDDDLRLAFNEELKKLRDSGELAPIFEPFGYRESDLPPADLTAEDLCQTDDL